MTSYLDSVAGARLPSTAVSSSASSVRPAGGGIQSYADSIKPNLPIFGAKYLDQLKQVAQVNPLVLNDELEKGRVVEARTILREFYESWNPVSPDN